MYFTQEDYKKIENWLHRNSVKDTEFQEALPFTGKEIVTVVQDGHNRKVNIQEFINQLYKHGVEDFLNVTNTYRANNITLKEAIRLIPAEARKEGQVITFLNTDGNWEIYQFIGKLNQWNNPTLWNNPFDWEKLVVDSILPDEEDLTKSASDAKGNAYISLKNRKYEPDKYSGLGRKILRRRVVEIEDPIYGTQEKNLLLQADFAEDNTVYIVRYDFTLNGQDITLPDNSYIEYEGGSISDGNIIDRAGGLNRVVLKKNIINGKNILTQEMISKSNTIYEIRYDFDLNNTEITISEGCILDFKSGSFNNGVLNFKNTKLIGDVSIKDTILKGSLLNTQVNLTWFGITPENTPTPNGIDISDTLQMVIDFISLYSRQGAFNTTLFIPKGWYGISKTIYIRNRYINIVGEEGIGLPTIYALKEMFAMFQNDETSTIKDVRILIKNICFWGDNKSVSIDYFSNYDSLVKYGLYFNNGFLYAYCENCTFEIFKRWAIFIDDAYPIHFKKIKVTNCHNGIYLIGNINGCSITESLFTRIKYFGVSANNAYTLTISNNCFDSLGSAAIYLGGGANFVITNNYFEVCSAFGIQPHYFNNNPMPKRVYAPIIINGATNSRIIDYGSEEELDNANIFARTYSCRAEICYNSLQQSNHEGALDCFVFASSLKYSAINNNMIWTHPTEAVSNNYSVLGCSTDSQTTNIHDVEITNNSRGTETLFEKRVAFIDDLSDPYNNRISHIWNIYNNDVPLNTKLEGDLIKHLNYYAYSGTPTFQFNGEYFKNKKVFNIIKNGLLICRRKAGKGDAYTSYFTDEDLNGQWFEVKYHYKNNTDGGWNTRIYTVSNIEISIPVTEGTLITEPQINLIGSTPKYIELDDQFYWRNSINSYLQSFILPKNTKIKVTGNINDNSAISVNTRSPLLFLPIKNGIIECSNEVRKTIETDNECALKCFDTTLKKYFTLKEGTWYDDNGFSEGIKYQGTFAERPYIPGNVGFAYFCTDRQTTEGATNGIMIYHKGEHIWVDALGRIVQ